MLGRKIRSKLPSFNNRSVDYHLDEEIRDALRKEVGDNMQTRDGTRRRAPFQSVTLVIMRQSLVNKLTTPFTVP